jgi:hypothetical protein
MIVFTEGIVHRPGVMENLGLGPGVFLGPQGLHHRLIYARLVGSVMEAFERSFR